MRYMEHILLDEMKYALIGDVKASRGAKDQAVLFHRLGAILDWVNGCLNPVQPLKSTVGDEFQGLFPTGGSALWGSLLLLVRAIPDVELRIGLGEGTVEIHGDDARSAPQSGTAWWYARDAIDTLVQTEGRSRAPRTLSTWLKSDDGTADARTNAYLMIRDHVLRQFDSTDATILLGLLDGKTQDAIADSLETTQSNVSRRASTRGMYNLLRGAELLSEERDRPRLSRE